MNKVEKVYCASPMQQGMYFHDMMSDYALYYNQVRFGIEGLLDIEVFKKSVQLLVDTHEVLRSRYFLSGEKNVLVGIIAPFERQQEVGYVDISNLKEDEVETYIENEVKKGSNQKINLEKGELMNMTLYKIKEDYHVLIWGCHHISLDGWCMSLLIKELFDYYDCGIKGIFEIKDEVPYSSYLEWLDNTDRKDNKDYWDDYLSDKPEAFLLPTGKKMRSYCMEREHVRLTISKEKMDIVRNIASKYHLTLSTVVQGLWGLLLCKYSNRKEAIWGCVTSGRSVTVDQVENIVGLFINTMPVVYHIDEKQSMVNQLYKLGVDIFQAEFKSSISLNEISENSQELFNHIFAFENLEFADMLQGVSFENLKISNPHFYDRTNYDLTIKAQPSDELYIEWHYNPEVYDKEGIDAIAGAYEYLLEQFIEEPEKEVKNYKLLSDEQERNLRYEINKNYKGDKTGKTFQKQFLEVVSKYPDNIALSEDGNKISYKELLHHAERVAAYLQSLGASQGDVIGIDAEGGVDTIECIIGILMAGCAYLPLDLNLPEQRRQFYVKQTKMSMVFSEYKEKYREVSHILSKKNSLSFENDKFIEPDYKPEDLAYIIFTSGSTGEPKGVSVSSGALCSFGTIGKNSIQYGEPQDRVAQIAVLSFDASIYEIFTTVMTGGTIVVATQQDKETAVSLTQFFRKEKITRSFITMQLFQLMVDEDVNCFENARSISAGGERASAKHFFKMAKANPKAKMINGYGPTECICLSSGYYLSSDAETMEEIPIGYPEENHTYYVLDEEGNLCPPYAEGELYIGGANASGYFGRDDLTDEVFVDNSFEEGGKLYKSGDMVKYIPGEGMLYVHRRDSQIKIRGFRIEAGEIENAIKKCRNVKQGCVRIVEKSGSWKIFGYYIAEKTILPEEIKEQLSRILPNYMIPNALLQLSEFPMNKNGKLDVRALPDIETDTETAYVFAQNKIQQDLLEIWQEVLGNKEIGIRHNFFEFGGDSIKAMQIIGLMKKFGYNAEIRTLFQNPTIEKFSEHVYIGKRESQEEVEGACTLLPIQKHFFAQKYENQNQFNQSALLKLKVEVTTDLLDKIMSKLIEHHDMLRAVYVVENGEYTQQIRTVGHVSYEIHEFELDGNLDRKFQVDEQISKLQSRMDLEKGILLQVGLFKAENETYLFIAVHHIVMDGVSFRIILRDLGELLNGEIYNQYVGLVPKTVSYQKYASALEAAEDEEFELPLWEEIDTTHLESIAIKKNKKLKLGDRSTKVFSLDDSVKSGIEEYIKVIRGLEFADVLLALVGKAINDELSISNFAIDIEHNGRGFKNQSFDLSNTVGWFTSIYPLVLDIKNKDIENLIETVSHMQQTFRKFSAEYMIKRISPKSECGIYKITPEICFNYLGSFEQGENSDAPFEMVVQVSDTNRAKDQATPYVLEINSLMILKKLQIMIDYDSEVISEEQITSMVERINHYAQQLKDAAKAKFYEPFPLSSLQMAYFIGKQDFYELGGFTTHNYMEMETQVDIKRLNEALQKLIVNQEMLRTIVVKDGTQKVLKEIPTYTIQMEDLRGMTKEEQENRIQEKRKELSHYVFDIYHFPLFDIGGFLLTDEDKYLFIGYDTIMLDSGSVNLMIRDLAHYYLHPEETPLPLEYHYRDYIHDWENLKTQQLYEDAKEYWESKLETFPEAPQLPMICDPESVTKGHFLRKVKRYSTEEYGVLKRQSAAHGMTISALLLSVYAHTMCFYSGMDKFALNLTIFNRPTFHKDIERLYGDFTSTILLDFDLSEGKNFWEESEKVQGTLGKALEYRIYDGIYFSRDVMRKFRYPKTKAMMPMVFTSLLFEQDIWDDVKKLGEVKWQIGQTPQVYVDFNVLEQSGELVIQMDYVSELFDDEMIERVFKSFCRMLDDVAFERPEIELPSLTEKEKKQRAIYNNTQEKNPVETTLTELFKKSVERYPDKVALICGKEKLTYQELNRMSDRVANDLIKQGLAHSAVGLYTERKIGTVVNILGILKAGGCYVPILPEFPKERVNYIWKTGKLTRIVYPQEYIELPDAEESLEVYRPVPDDSAYILFTSGSTGTPKGVEIANKSVANTILGANSAYGIEPEDVFIGMSEMSFDLSVYDIFGAFGIGGTLVMVPDVHAIENIANMVEEYKITVWQTVPALMQMYMRIRKPGQGSSLKHIILGGDFIPMQLARDILEKLPQARFMSLGGPTEITIMDICYEITEIKDEWKSIPYGYPIRNSQIYIMDSNGRECPNEVRGEIWSGGMGLAKGYLEMPELNAEKFIEHPKYGRLFKTGDYGIFKNEGYVEICGRQDGQVKIQGMRIELGEIENVFLKHPGVSQAAAIIHEGKNGTKQIAVFVETDKEKYSVQELMEYAKEYLTDYMRPSVLKIMDKIPLSGNNKIDRRTLSDSIEEMQTQTRTIALPENETEKLLLAIWKDVLKVEEAGVEDDFFESGGDSLKAMELLAQIKIKMNWETLLLTDILKAGTIRKLAEFKLSGAKGNILRNLSEISGTKKKIFFIHGGNGSSDSYRKIVSDVEDHADCYGIDFMKSITLEPKKISLKGLAEEYAESILEITDSSEEVTLVGWCIGGTICFEIAYILENSGYNNIKLMFMDTQEPGENVIYDYNAETEIEFIKEHAFGFNLDSLKDKKSAEELWNGAIAVIESDKEAEKKVKEAFLTQTAGILMHPEQLSIREVIMLNNFFRSTVDNAHNTKVSGKLKHTKAIYIQAEEGSVAQHPEKWQEYFENVLEIRVMSGSHFEIMEQNTEKYSDWLG